MIKLQIIGHLGKDAEVRDVNGRKVIAFNVAHSEKYRDAKGELQSRTTWVSCSYWTETANVAPYMKKGGLVYAEGTPSVDAYMSSAQNQPAATLRMNVLRVELLGGTEDRNNQTGAQSPGQEQGNKAPATSPAAVNDSGDEDGDLPF